MWLALVLLLCTPAMSADLPEGYISVNGQARSYLLYKPASLASPPALYVILHGGKTGTAKGMRLLTGYQFERLADRTGGIVVYPSGYSNSWADGRGVTDADKAGVDDVAFLLALRAQLQRDHGTGDTYLTGISNGGFMAMRFACEAPVGVLQGVGAVAATRATGLACPRTAPLPFVLIAGASDPIVNYYGGDTASLGTWMSVETLTAEWVKRNGCSTLISPSWANTDANSTDGTVDVGRSWWFCDAPTEAHSVIGMGHTWPSGWQYAPVLGPFGVGPVSREGNVAEIMYGVWR